MSLNKILLVLPIVGLLAVGACNTIEGAGKDIEKAGDSIEDAANDARN